MHIDEEQLKTMLAKRISPHRMTHSLGVRKTAVALARRYHADALRASVAGLLHDCARDIPRNNLLQLAEEFGIVVDDLEKHAPVLLHARVGAEIIVREFNIPDPAIYRAVALHTTGGKDMTVLDKIIYLADYIEPGRDYPGVDKLRELAELDLDRAVLAAFDQTLCYLVQEHMLIHPHTLEGRNAFLLNLNK